MVVGVSGGKGLPFAGIVLAGGFFNFGNGGGGEKHFALVVKQPIDVEGGVCVEQTDDHF